MKKFESTFTGFDQKVDRVIRPFWGHFKKYFPFFSAALLTLLLLFFLVRVLRDKPFFATNVLTSDINKIVQALNKIDKDCSILSIENVQNQVDFLTVKDFVGSEIGSLNLGYPKKWQGPYLLDSPRFKGKLYQLIKTRSGAFVLPGNGVKLPNGLIIGKSFRVTYDTDISRMLLKDGQLNYKGTPLGEKLEFRIGDLGKTEMKRGEIEEINRILEEFNDAMPFTYNQTIPYKC